MKDFIYKKLLILLILFQPIIDIITSYMTLNGFNLTIGIIYKVFILGIATFYLLFLDKEKRKHNIIFVIMVFILSMVNIYANKNVIKLFAFGYFNYLSKYVYHLIILYFFMRWYKNYNIKLYELRIPIIIIVFSYLISLITGTAYLSYDIYREGYSGWYSSANELGNLLCLFFPISIYNAFHNKDGIKFDIVLFVLNAFCLLMIGTKVGLLGFYLIVICYLVLRLVFIKKKKLDLGFIFVLGTLIISLCFFMKLPGVYNIKFQLENGNEDYLLSNRDLYYRKIKDNYDKSPFINKVVGVTYYETTEELNSILVIEQDFFDIFFMYGLIGIVVITSFYIIIYINFIKSYLYYRKKNKYSKKYLSVIIAITIEFAVAFISGHSLLSPSVSTYLCLIIALSLNFEYNIASTRKKNIIINKSSEAYNKLDQEKYDVYVLGNDPNYACINPYFTSSWFNNRIFKNKIVAYLLTRNQKFDIVIYGGKDIFEENFLNYVDAKKKYTLNKEGRLIKESITINQINQM